jgi:selenocysteine lyase/cysteine desulfurase
MALVGRVLRRRGRQTMRPNPTHRQRIYLDFNATTPLAPEVAGAMRQALQEPFGNPSSAHWAGRPAREAVENARA